MRRCARRKATRPEEGPPFNAQTVPGAREEGGGPGPSEEATSSRNFLMSEVPLYSRNVQRFQGGLVFKAHRLLYHATLGFRVIKKRKKKHR